MSRIAKRETMDTFDIASLITDDTPLCADCSGPRLAGWLRTPPKNTRCFECHLRYNWNKIQTDYPNYIEIFLQRYPHPRGDAKKFLEGMQRSLAETWEDYRERALHTFEKLLG